MFQAVRICFSKYFTFSGRARRPEYWWFLLFLFVGSAALALADAALFGSPPADADGDQTGPLQGLFQLVTFIPMLAVGWRRMHDTGRTGWLLLLPVAVSLALAMALITGVAILSFTTGVDSASPSPEEAAALHVGLGAAVLGGIALIVIYVLMIWWLTRPTEPQDNRFGPLPPEWNRG